MKRGHWQLSVLAPIAAAALALAGAPAHAQTSSLSSEVYSAQSLTGEQLQQVQGYAQVWGGYLLNPQADEQVREGRRRLLEPLSMNTSETFRSAYAEAVAEEVSDAMESENVLSRINAAILAARLPLNPNVVAMVRQGLQDENPAVQYWSVKALVGRSAALEPAVRQQFLQELDQLLARDQDSSVLEQVYRAMVNIDGENAGAIGRVLTSLNARVATHASRPSLDYRAEHAGLTAAYSRLLSLRANNVPNLQPHFNQLAAAAVRYMDLIGRQGQQAADRLDEPTLTTYTQMLTLTAQILTTLHRETGAATPLPGGIEQNINARNWAGIVDAAQAFRPMLTAPPFNLTAEALALPGGQGAQGAQGAQGGQGGQGNLGGQGAQGGQQPQPGQPAPAATE